MSRYTEAVMFITGIGIGAICTYYYMKDKYEKMIDKEIDSVKEVFAKKYSKKDEPENCEDSEANKLDREDPVSQVVEEINDKEFDEYVDKVKLYDIEQGSNEFETIAIVPPEKFGEMSHYDMVTLIYFKNKILTNEDLEIINDPKYLIGPDALKHFGEYEPDSVYVCNTKLMTYFEILANEREYPVTSKEVE